jgi:uncharacterized protein YgiB involved in biofilm formation
MGLRVERFNPVPVTTRKAQQQMKTKTTLALLVMMVGSAAYMAIAACFGDSTDADYESITDCSNFEGPNHIRMCDYRIYDPSLSQCTTRSEETHYDCVSEYKDCPYEIYRGGTCSSANPRCIGGNFSALGTNYNVRVMKRLIYCHPG